MIEILNESFKMNTTGSEDLNKTYFTTLFIIEGIIAAPTIFGNLLLVYCIKKYRYLHTKYYILIANLGVADLLFGIVFIPYDMMAMTFPEMRLHKVSCLLRTALLLDTVGASVFNLLILSVERYTAIAYPLWHLKSSRIWVLVSIAVSWALSTIIAVLPFTGWNTWNTTKKCIIRWNEALAKSYNILWSCVYVTSLIICFGLFIKVMSKTFRILNSGKNKDKNEHNFNLSARTLKRSVEKTKLFILILGIFAVCWGPYCVITILKPMIPVYKEQIFIIRNYCGILALSNSAVNWVVYGLKNQKIRRAFKMTLCSRRKRSDRFSSRQESSSQLKYISSLSL